MQFWGLRTIFKRIKAIKFFLKDKEVPKRKKALVIFGIIYLLMPIDLVPIVIFPFGITDDLILWVFILWHLKDELDSYWIGEKDEDLSKKFRSKNIVEGVEFEVYENDKSESDGKSGSNVKSERNGKSESDEKE